MPIVSWQNTSSRPQHILFLFLFLLHVTCNTSGGIGQWQIRTTYHHPDMSLHVVAISTD